MDEMVLAALARWPQVPSVYGWLSLDRRGNWRLQGEPVRHAGFQAFISRNYAGTAEGRWFFQNGPQRVFAALDYTPWVLRWHPADGFTRHTGQPVSQPASAWLDEAGNLLIGFEAGVGLVCDQDLPLLLARFSLSPNTLMDNPDNAVADFLAATETPPLWLHLNSGPLRTQRILASQVAPHFGFDPAPTPENPHPRP